MSRFPCLTGLSVKRSRVPNWTCMLPLFINKWMIGKLAPPLAFYAPAVPSFVTSGMHI